MKKLSGMRKASCARDDILKLPKGLDGTDGNTDDELPNLGNESFLVPMKDYLPSVDFSISVLQPACRSPLVISVASVFKKLSEINSGKAKGPDGILG